MKKKNVLLEVTNLQKYFPIKKTSIFQREQEYVKANKNISLEIFENETLGLVGESGCGKSTFGRTLIQLYEQTGGVSLYYGETVDEMMPNYVKDVYKSMPKLFINQTKDYKELVKLDEEIKQSSGDAFIALNETYRLKKIAYDNTYGNIFRLAGGLLVHDNLNEVRDLLLKKHDKGSAVAFYKKQIDIEELRIEVRKNASDKKLKQLEAKAAIAIQELDVVNAEISKLKESLKDHKDFNLFEDKYDNGVDLSSLDKNEMRFLRKDLQIIFQDPYSSLDPRFTVGNIIGEGLIAHGIFKDNKSQEYTDYIVDIMAKCGLNKEFIHRYPHQFSGGQRQRIGIARALAMRPKFIVCDEAVSALDVSIQSQVINLLEELKDNHNLTYLFITHDLGVVRYISDRIGVMYFGNLVELAPAENIFTNPQHPYTKALLAAIPRMEADQAEIDKLLVDVPNELFDFTYQETGEADQDWYEVAPDHFVACRLLSNVAKEEL